MNNKIIFISGIDTNCGKTIITGLFAKYLLEKGKKVITQKLIQTGCENISEDIITHRKIMNVTLFDDDINKTTCPYNFKFPASPHLSAEKENIEISLETISKCSEILKTKYEYILIEGAGGLFVPINREYYIIDYIIEKKYPLILVTTSKLGSINHTLLNLEIIKSKKINLIAVVYNNYFIENNDISTDSYLLIKEYTNNSFPNAEVLKIEKVSNKYFMNDFSKIFNC